MMSDYVVLPDLCCDLSPRLRERFGLENYIKGRFSINGGREYVSAMDWSHISMREFYSVLGDSGKRVTTSPASEDEYFRVFEEYVSQGLGVLSMSVSSTASEFYSASLAAAERVLRRYPDANIRCFDSLRMSGGFGLLVIYALEMQRNGASMEEVYGWLESNKRRVHQMGPIVDLALVKKRGRVSLGGTLKIPAGEMSMGDCNNDGFVTVIGSCEGIENALRVTAEYVKKTITDPENGCVLINQTDRYEEAKILKSLIEGAVPVKEVFVSDVFPGVASHVGAGMVGAYYLGEELSRDLSKEKAILTSLLER